MKRIFGINFGFASRRNGLIERKTERSPHYEYSDMRPGWSVPCSDPRSECQALLVIGGHARSAESMNEIIADLVPSHHVTARHCTFPEWDCIEDKAVGDLLDLAERANIVVLVGFTPAELDGLFQLRVHQILRGRAAVGARSIAILYPIDGISSPSGFARRARSSWPFRELVLLGETAAAAAQCEQLVGAEVCAYSRETFRLAVAGSNVHFLSTASASQQVAVQIQPSWGRCGSTTAFENEIEELVELGYFVVRIFIERQTRRGHTLIRAMRRIIAENSVHAGAHINGLAASAGPVRERHANARALDEFLEALRVGRDCCGLQVVITELAATAKTAVVNHVVNLGFALKACPLARLLLDTHDYFTRQAFEKSGRERDLPKFPSRAELSRMARSEASLWGIPDFCTTVNQREQAVVAKYAVRSEIVLPRPYVPGCTGQGQQVWDVLVVADQHEFNIRSVRWLLNVIRSDPVLRRARVAIVGRVGAHIRRKEYSDLSNVKFLGFVRELDTLRNTARLSAIPDQAGTGIAIKTLTALAASHPVVVTRAGVRGLSLDPGTDLVAHDTASSFANDLVHLLSDDDALERRRMQSASTYARLLGGWSFTRCLATVPEPDSETVARRSQLMAKVLESHREPAVPEAEPAVADDGQWDFRLGGSAQPILRDGWHAGEPWGRWMDGPSATLEIKLSSSLTKPLTLTLRTRPCPAGGLLGLSINGTQLKPRRMKNVMRWHITDFLTNNTNLMRIEFGSSVTYCWADHENTADQRIVGMGFRSLKISRQSMLQRLFHGAGKICGMSGNG